jgi:hypothetical protein
VDLQSFGLVVMAEFVHELRERHEVTPTRNELASDYALFVGLVFLDQ